MIPPGYVLVSLIGKGVAVDSPSMYPLPPMEHQARGLAVEVLQEGQSC